MLTELKAGMIPFLTSLQWSSAGEVKILFNPSAWFNCRVHHLFACSVWLYDTLRPVAISHYISFNIYIPCTQDLWLKDHYSSLAAADSRGFVGFVSLDNTTSISTLANSQAPEQNLAEGGKRQEERGAREKGTSYHIELGVNSPAVLFNFIGLIKHSCYQEGISHNHCLQKWNTFMLHTYDPSHNWLPVATDCLSRCFTNNLSWLAASRKRRDIGWTW